METLLIVDDKNSVRSQIKEILDNDSQPLKILEAKNGKEALKLCQENSVDILITDMNMPEMNGVELMQKIREEKFNVKIIAISQHTDFFYAQAAVAANAISYILKPLNSDELRSCVHRALEATRHEKHIAYENELKQIALEGIIKRGSGIKGKIFPNGFYCVFVATEKKFLPQNFAADFLQFYILEQRSDLFCFAIPAENLDDFSNVVLPYAVCAGASSITQSLAMLRTAKRQAFCSMLKNHFLSPPPHPDLCLSHYEEFQIDFSKLDAAYERLVGRLKIFEPAAIQKFVDSLFLFEDENPAHNAECLFYFYNKITSDLFLKFPNNAQNDSYKTMKQIQIETIWRAKNIREWKRYVCDYCVYFSATLTHGSAECEFIKEAIEYINKNFTKNINMAVVANQVSVNYTWFSEKFKQQTHSNFTEYLKTLRIEEAKRLLKKDCYKIYEVSQLSGFGDVKHFLKTFRKQTGKTPSEWAKTN